MQTTGEYLRRMRCNVNMTQRTASQRTGIPPQTISDLERNKYEPRDGDLYLLQKCYVDEAYTLMAICPDYRRAVASRVGFDECAVVAQWLRRG